MSEISTKEQIIKFKDYADIADASYAMLHWVSENEKNGLDDLYSKFGKDNVPENIANSYKKQEIEKPVWRYADDVRKGDTIDELSEKAKNNGINFGDPTAYALAIEARFNQDMVITKPKVNEQSEPKVKSIDNEVQSFIATPDDKPPYIFVNKENYHQLSLRTKAFVNRYELVHHIKNTSITGFSSTVFYDSKFNNYIIGFRGTELGFKDLVFTDGMIALLGAGLNQIASMAMLKSDMYDAIKEHKANSGDTSEISNLVLSGHSLGGHLAQSFAFLYTKDVKELYTFNAPGFGGAFASLVTISLRFVSFIAKAIMKGVRWIARVLDPNGFVGKIVGSVFKKIKNMFGFKDDKSTVEDCVNLTKDNEKACKEVGNKEVSSNINKSSKGSHEVEIHHCDSVRHKIYDKNDEGLFDASDDSDGDSLKREWNQLYEPSTSVISDLGFRYGLGAESLDGHLAEYDYKNTKKLHLINILVASHFMKQIVESLYLMEYLLSNEKNEAKIKDKDVPAALDYLNDYIQSLSFNVYFYKISLGYLPKLGSEDKKRLSILESVIYPVALYVNSLGFEDENEAPNLEDPVSSLLYYKEKDKFVDMIDREEVKALDAKDIASKVKSGDVDLFFAIYSVRYFMLSKKADLKAFKDRMSYISDFFKIASSHANSNSNEKELEQYINTRLEIYRSAYELKFESFKYADDNKHYVVIAKTNTDKKITRGIVLTHNFKLIDNVAKDAKNDVAKEYLNVIRLEPNELMHISEGKVDILLRDKSIFDINQVSSDLDIDFTKLKTQVYIIDKPLNTATEQSDYPLYFKKEEDGEEENSSLSFTHQPRDEDKDKGRLSVTYKNSQASILNYSLLNKSLNIDLKPTNKETKESLEKANERISLEKQSSVVSASGTAFANPIIEDDVVVCPHGGHVILKSRAGRSIRSDDQGVILDIDFINSPIVGCSAHNPCTKVAYVPRAALSIKSMNDHYAVMQDLVPACLSNTGSPLRCIKKENRIKLAHSIGSPTSENDNPAVLNPNLNSAHIRLHVKSALNQADNLAVCIYKLNDVEHKNQEGFKEMELNLDEGGDVKDKKLKEYLNSRFREDKFSISSFNFKYSLMDKNFIFITPKYIESIYKNTTLPKSGIGFFQFVDDISDESNLIYVTPSKAKTVDIKFACGLDSKYNDDINTTKTVVVA